MTVPLNATEVGYLLGRVALLEDLLRDASRYAEHYTGQCSPDCRRCHLLDRVNEALGDDR